MTQILSVRYYVHMNMIISTTEARKKLFDIIKDVASPHSIYTLTERGNAKAVIMSAVEFESWLETLEVNHLFPNLTATIARSKKDYAAGKYTPLSKLSK